MRRTVVRHVTREKPEPDVIDEAAAIIRHGGLVAFPTETVYGLGASGLDAAAVSRIFEAKDRPPTDPLILHLRGSDQIALVAREVPPMAASLAARFWPGPLTLILPKQSVVPSVVTAGLGTVGVRVAAHPVARALIAAAGVPIAAPSANRFSRPSPTRAEHVLADLDGRIDLVLDAGPTEIGVESTVLDVTTSPPRILRPGGVSVEMLREMLPDVTVVERYGSASRADVSPGQFLRHYAPRARVTLYEGTPERVVAKLAADVRARTAAGVRIGVLAPEDDVLALAPLVAAMAATGRVISQAYGSRGEPARAAHELFAALRTVDAADVDEILAVAPEATHLGRAIRDRLLRAAEGRVCCA
jgi:L-threonylcarbamoyladenylate synthase